jgi:hypothetical protein
VDDIKRPKNAQVVTAAPFEGPSQWLVNILSYNDNVDVIEAVQIQDFLQGIFSIFLPLAFGGFSNFCNTRFL